MRDAAFVKACSLIERFRKESQHWRKLLYQVSDEQSVANKALTDIAKHCGLKSWTIPQLVESVGLALAEDPAALQEALSKMTKERDAQSALVAKQRHLLAAKQTEIGALEAERDALKREVERLQGIKPELPPREGRGEGLPRYGLRWNGPDRPVATPMDDGFWVPWHLAKAAEMERTEWKREVESLRAKLAVKTVEWPEWAKEGTRVRVRSTHSSITHAAQYCVGDEFVIEELDEDDWSANAGGRWAFLGDLEPVAEHTQPAVAVQS